MKKIIRLTESELVRLVKRILKEEEKDILSTSPYDENFDGMTCKKAHQMASKIVNYEGKKAIDNKENEKPTKQKSILYRLNKLIKEINDPKKLEILKKIRKKMENCVDNKRDSDGGYNSAF